jgi:hypothetical protein
MHQQQEKYEVEASAHQACYPQPGGQQTSQWRFPYLQRSRRCSSSLVNCELAAPLLTLLCHLIYLVSIPSPSHLCLLLYCSGPLPPLAPNSSYSSVKMHTSGPTLNARMAFYLTSAAFMVPVLSSTLSQSVPLYAHALLIPF